jgi:uncharacterized protein YndB with AHSA1/START domain
MNFPQQILTQVRISTNVQTVWKYLTEPTCMQKWMGDENMALQVHCSWELNSTLRVSGFTSGHKFESKGRVLSVESNRSLKYSLLSTLSNLEETEQNASLISFTMIEEAEAVELYCDVSNFVTFEIYAHHNFYWPVALQMLKKQAEMTLPH